MGEALKEARKAFDNGEVPVGAVVVCSKTKNYCESTQSN